MCENKVIDNPPGQLRLTKTIGFLMSSVEERGGQKGTLGRNGLEKKFYFNLLNTDKTFSILICDDFQGAPSPHHFKSENI